jgi:hypothetical protein
VTPLAVAAAADQEMGWGGPVAILIAFALFAGFVAMHRKITNPSPTPPGGADTTALEQGHDGDTTPDRGADTTRDTRFPRRDTTSPGTDTDADTTWYGPIVTLGGRRFRQVAHIVRTGDSPPPEPEPADDLGDMVELVADPPPATVEEWLARADAADMPYSDMVRGAIREYGVSDSTAKRRIREMRERGTE